MTAYYQLLLGVGSVAGQESGGHVSAVDLESLGAAGQRRGTEIMQKTGEEQQLGIEVCRPQPFVLGHIAANR
jgi:hypothetical protein